MQEEDKSKTVELNILRDEIYKILRMQKSEKVKAEQIWSAVMFFQRKLLIVVNQIESKIVNLQEQFINTSDDALQDIDSKMKTLLFRLFEIYDEKNNIEGIIKAVPDRIWEQVQELEKQRMVRAKELREEILNFDEDFIDAHRFIEILESLNMIDPVQLKYDIDAFIAGLDEFEDEI